MPSPGHSQRGSLISCFFSFPLHDGYIPAASVSPGQVTGKHLAPFPIYCSGSERLIGRWEFVGLKARGILSPEGGIIVAGRRRVAAEPLVMRKKLRSPERRR